MFYATAVGLDNTLSASGKVKRAFHLMKRDNKNRVITAREFHDFLTHCGMEISPEHSERITELISEHGEEYFTEAELVQYVTEYHNNEERKREQQEAAERSVARQKKSRGGDT